MRQEYTFTLNPQEGQIIVAALKELPMKIVEPVINKLEMQFQKQVQADILEEEKNKDKEAVVNDHNSAPTALDATNVVPVTKRKTKVMKPK